MIELSNRRSKSYRAVMAAMLVAVLVSTVAIPIGLQRALNTVETTNRLREQELVSNYVEQAKLAAVTQQKAQLTWDDAFRSTGDHEDLAWADTNIGQFLWNTFGYDQLFLVKPDGAYVRGWREGHPAIQQTYVPLESGVRQALAQLDHTGEVFGNPAGYRRLADTPWPYDATGVPLTRWSADLIRYENRPALLTILSILPDTQFGLLNKRPHFVVAVRYLDGRFVTDITKSLLLRNAGLAAGGSSSPGLNTLALTSRNGETIGWLTWSPSQANGQLKTTFLPILAAYALFIVVVILLGYRLFRTIVGTLGELTASEAQAQHGVLHDTMTGLPNRRFLYQDLDARLAALDGDESDAVVVVAFFDVDHFKLINDTLGHHVGDELVCQVARRLRASLPDEDVIARLGGDEFVLLRTSSRGHDAQSNIGEEIKRIFAEPFQVFDNQLNVTVSCGVSWAPDHTRDSGELLRNADIALYRAKQRGRGRWRAFLPQMEAEIRWRHDLEVELRQALARDELRLVYQPIVAADGHHTVAFEALLRWHHPTRGDIGPGVFVPIAEQSGLMVEMGRWLLARAFGETRTWTGHDVTINLSPIQIMSRGFIEHMRKLVEDLSVDTRRIIFEITEGVMLDRSDHVINILNELKAMGFRIALDDFGTGFSSLGYLRSFPFDHIKIDRLFVQNIEHDRGNREILKSIAALGQTLGMKIVAEGIETRAQVAIVAEAGCQLMQGYYFSHPLELAQVEEIERAAKSRHGLRLVG